MKIEDLEQIIRILKQNDVSEFEFDNDGVRIRLTRGSPLNASNGSRSNGVIDIEPAVVGAFNGHASFQPANEGQPEPVVPNNFVKVESPIVGTFYRRPSPDSDSFVSEGSIVKKGETLCIIEAMKLMNEIEAPISGKIEKILLTDAQVVEFGEVLFLISPE